MADWLLRLTETNKRWGFGLCFLHLRNVKGFRWNHKRVYRIYRELELNLRIKPRKQLKRDKPDPLDVPTAPNQMWSMDFMSDTLLDGRKLRTFNVIDDYNREGLAIDVDLSLPSARLVRSLEQIIEWRRKPAAIRCDNGPELLAGPIMEWAEKNRLKWGDYKVRRGRYPPHRLCPVAFARQRPSRPLRHWAGNQRQVFAARQ